MRKVATFLGATLSLAWVVPASAQGGAPDMFKDLDTTHRAYQAVENLRAKNIVWGYPDQYFRGKRTLSSFGIASPLAAFTMLDRDKEWGVGPVGPINGPTGPIPVVCGPCGLSNYFGIAAQPKGSTLNGACSTAWFTGSGVELEASIIQSSASTPGYKLGLLQQGTGWPLRM